MNLQAINDSYKDLNNKFKSVKELNNHVCEIEQEAIKNEEEDGTRQFLSTFFEEAQNQILEIEVKIKKIEEKFKDVLRFYGENTEMSIELFFETFTKFNKDLTVLIVIILE